MYVHINNFDYDELLNNLVQHYHLSDAPITNEIISKIFEELAEHYKLNQRETMTEDEIALVEEFMRIHGQWSDFQPGDEADMFLETKGMDISESLVVMEGLFLEGVTEDDELDPLYDIAIKFTQFDFTDEDSIGEFSAYLSDLISKYNNIQFNDAELYVLGHIERSLDSSEILTGIEVLPVAGKVVKYGDTLITFPIILIKVSKP